MVPAFSPSVHGSEGNSFSFWYHQPAFCDATLPSHLYLKQLRAARMPTATALAQRQLRPFRAWVKSSMNNSLSCCWRSWGYLAMGGGSDGCFPSSPKSWWVCKTWVIRSYAKIVVYFTGIFCIARYLYWAMQLWEEAWLFTTTANTFFVADQNESFRQGHS